ncbi:MAG TPA: hypothetical protein VL403_16195 [Candidatus Kryptonia bacterium]|nr:hypothetical protein [Candidatus Kryptonia bacterium]
MLDYQRTVWSDPAVTGYNELVDMTTVTDVQPYSPSEIKQFAILAARMDAMTLSSRLAIVAPDDFAFGLGRMYQAYREVSPAATKQVAVLRDRASALQWLGLNELD